MKMRLSSVLALVIGSQIGSGVFMSPSILSPYGGVIMYSYIAAAVGAMSIALVFARLCSLFPRTGGPHVYVLQAFGEGASFFTGWTYWLVSWISSVVVIKSCVGYLAPILSVESPAIMLVLEILSLLLITCLNLYGVKTAGSAEFVLSLLKVVPLVIVPAIAIMYFNSGNFFSQSEAVKQASFFSNFNQGLLIIMWGFIGIEVATTPASSVVNPNRTIPRAIIIGTLIVTCVYVINSVAVHGALSTDVLSGSRSPYADLIRYIIHGRWYMLVSLIASVVCFGTLNAWVLSSGQVALGVAQDGLLPRIFSKKNRYDAPYFSIIVSTFCTIPLLVCTYEESFASQLIAIIDFSVLSFIFVYTICTLSLLKVLISRSQLTVFSSVYIILSLCFTLWIIVNTEMIVICCALFFTLSGLPIYYFHLIRRGRKMRKVREKD